jgi:hypothetical protein
MSCYHALILFLWISVLERARFLFLAIGLAAISIEGVLCVLFADMRFLSVSGLRLNQLTAGNSLYLATYLGLALFILGVACREIRRAAPVTGTASSSETVPSSWLTVSKKVLTGLLIIAIVVAVYSLYCLRFY